MGLYSISSASEWHSEEILVHSGINSDCDLVIDAAGGLHTCFHYRSNSLPGADLYYAFKADAAGSWEITPVDVDYSNVVGACCEIGLDSQENPHISYIYDWEIEDLPYIKYAASDGSTWATEQLTFSPEYASTGTSILMEDDNPHIFYFKYCTGLTHQWMNQLDIWTTETLDAACSIMYPQAAIDPSGEMGVAYLRMASAGSVWELHYAHHEGISWQLETAYSGNPCTVYWQLDMAYDQDGFPHIVCIAFQHPDNLSLLLHTSFDGFAWRTDTLGAIDTGTFSAPSIAVDDSNFIHIVYGERPYTNCDGAFYDGTWHHISDESGAWVDVILKGTINPWNSAIEIDLDNQPHIVSYADGITSHTWRTGTTTVGMTPDLNRALLGQVYPNPFNPQVTIPLALASPGHLRLSVHDVRGRRMALLVDRMLPAGEHRFSWDGRDESGRELASGIYLLRLLSGETRSTRRLTLLR